MFIACWSAKGGAGTTVVTAGLGLLLSHTGRLRPAAAPARRRPPVTDDADGAFEVFGVQQLGGEALLVDLAGDLPAVLGLPEPSGPGITDWLAAGADVPPDGLARLELPVSAGLSLLPRGTGELVAPERAEVLAGLLAGDGRQVIVDCGRLDPPSHPGRSGSAAGDATDVVRVLVASATQSLLVTRSCYLALRRFLRLSVQPSGVVLLTEIGRSLSALDVEEICNAPVIAEISVDAAVMRAVDSGLLAQRVPRGLARALLRAA